MQEYIVNRQTVQNIADAIRNKMCISDTLQLANMPDKIANLQEETMLRIMDGSISQINYNNINISKLRPGIFYQCFEVTEAIFPNVTDIGESAFGYCSSLSSVALPKITNIENNVFASCSQLTSISLPLVENIGQQAFQNCTALTDIDCPNLKQADSYTFENTALSNINFPLLIKIGRSCFSKCKNLQTAVFPMVTEVGGYAFSSSNIHTVDFHSKVQFGEWVFNGANNFTTLILRSDEVCTFDVWASSPLGWNNPMDDGVGHIYVPALLLEKYKSTSQWNSFVSQILPLGAHVGEVPRCILTPTNNMHHVDVGYFTADEFASITVDSSDTSIATTANVIYNDGVLTFDINAFDTEGTAIITISLNASDGHYERTFEVVMADGLSSYSVEAVDDALYGFMLNDSGYYESTNTELQGTISICKVLIFSNGVDNLYIDCINDGSSGGIYGMLSMVDTTLENNVSADTINVLKSFEDVNYAAQTIDYGVLDKGYHFIYIKHFHTPYRIAGEDSFQFRVRFE